MATMKTTKGFTVHDENSNVGAKSLAKNGGEPTSRRALGQISSNTLSAREESNRSAFGVVRKSSVQKASASEDTILDTSSLPVLESTDYAPQQQAIASESQTPLFSVPIGDDRDDLLDLDLEDVDAGDMDDPQAVMEYVKEIYRFLWRTEGNLAPSTTYFSKQTDINEKMRSILVDWLVDVHLKFKLRPETLYLTVNIIDRFLSKQNVSRQKLQLLGVSAMLIASKYEEIYAPEVRDFVYISDKAYTREEILKFEGLILSKLDFRLTVATPWTFAKRFCKVAKADPTTEMLVSFILERALLDYGMLKHMPSMIVSSAVYLAQQIRGQPAWTPLLMRYTHYTEATLMPCVNELRAFVRSAPESSLKAVYRKYSHAKYLEVAKLAKNYVFAE